MLFTGSYEHSIDAKHRLAIPAEIRSQWSFEEDGAAWYALPWVREKVIRLYTERYFKSRAAGYFRSLTPGTDEAKLNRVLFGSAARLEMDTAGRIRLPERLITLVGLGGEVTLVGSGDWLEIQDREEWNRTMRADLEELPDLLARLEEKSAERRVE